MEPEFDKVIDALMRSSPLIGGAAKSASGGHLDADEISAFAENAVPDTAKHQYILHFADCGRCRSILADVIALNADSIPESAVASPSIGKAAAIDIPWYKRLFAVPNLAYAIGGLVIVFTGLIGYSVLNNLSAGDTMMSQTANVQSEFLREVADTTNAANTASNITPTDTELSVAANASNAAANSNSAETYRFEPTQTPKLNEYSSELNEERREAPAAMPPPPVPLAAPPISSGQIPTENESKAAVSPEVDRSTADTTTQASQKDKLRSAPRSDNDLNASKIESLPRLSAAPSKISAKKTIHGKTLELRDGVWYDSAYTGQPTTNIRRNTEQFRRLDANLRSIANNVSGPVVVLWRSTAYRID